MYLWRSFIVYTESALAPAFLHSISHPTNGECRGAYSDGVLYICTRCDRFATVNWTRLMQTPYQFDCLSKKQSFFCFGTKHSNLVFGAYSIDSWGFVLRKSWLWDIIAVFGMRCIEGIRTLYGTLVIITVQVDSAMSERLVWAPHTHFPIIWHSNTNLYNESNDFADAGGRQIWFWG